MIDRGRFLTAAAAAALPLIPRRADALTSITTQLEWIKDVGYAGYWVADTDGYFMAEGIAPTFFAGGPNLTSIEAIVMAGRADIGIDSILRVVDANAAGADLVIVGALYQKGPQGLLSLPANPVHTARDIIGKRVGVQQGGSEYIDTILRFNHLPLDYKQVVVGFDPEPLVQGACDVYLCYVEHQPLTLDLAHVPHVVALSDTLGYHTYAGTLFCRRDYLRTNRAALVGYLRALKRGWEAYFRDPARGAMLAVQKYGAALSLDPHVQLAISKAQLPFMRGTTAHGALAIDLQRVAGPIYETLHATGRTKLPAPAKFIDTSLLAEA